MKVTLGKRNDIDDWNARNFVIYYMEKYKEHTNDPDRIFSKDVWLMWGLHIKRFMKKLRLTNAEYKDYIDFLFSPKFKNTGIIGFMAIVSEKLYYRYKVQHESRVKENPRSLRRATDEEVESIKRMIAELSEKPKRI